MNTEINRGLESVSEAWHSVTENVGEGLSDYLVAIRMQLMQAVWTLFFAGLSLCLLTVAGISFLTQQHGFSLAVACLIVFGAVLLFGLVGMMVIRGLRPAESPLPVQSNDSRSRQHLSFAQEPSVKEARDEFVNGVRDIRRGVIKAISPIEVVRRHPLVSTGLLSLAGFAIGAGVFSSDDRDRIARLRRKVREQRSDLLHKAVSGSQRKSQANQAESDNNQGGFGSEVVAMVLPLLVSKLKGIAVDKGRDFLASRNRRETEPAMKIKVASDGTQRSSVAIPKGSGRADDGHYVQ